MQWNFIPTSNEGFTCNKPIPTPHIHIAHTIPYWLNGIPISKHHREIRNLQTYINKYRRKQELWIAKSKFTYVGKCVSNEQINQKLLNHLWKASSKFDVQITQTLMFWYAQYMGNHRRYIFWSLTYPNHNYTLCPNHKFDMWPHLLSTCTHPPTHKKPSHSVTQQSNTPNSSHTPINKITKCYTLVNASNWHNWPWDTTILKWLIRCTCVWHCKYGCME